NHVGPRLADTQWSNTNLAVVNWASMKIMWDEQEADRTKEVEDYQAAVRANRQLAIALQSQGLNEDAARFAYRAQVLQQQVLLRQIFRRKGILRQKIQTLGAYLFSLFLYLLV